MPRIYTVPPGYKKSAASAVAHIRQLAGQTDLCKNVDKSDRKRFPFLQFPLILMAKIFRSGMYVKPFNEI